MLAWIGLLLAFSNAVHGGMEDLGLGYDYSSAEFGPHAWGKVSDLCNGQAQSPISLSPETSKRLRFPQLDFVGYDRVLNDLSLRNGGHDAFIAINDRRPSRGSGRSAYVRGGALPGVGYWLHSVHFHWGDHDAEGSEHRVSGLAYPLEMHLVHVRADLESIAEGVAAKKGLAVLGVFFNRQPDQLTHSPKAVAEIEPQSLPLSPLRSAGLGSGVGGLIEGLKLQDLLPNNTQVESFYRYDGSLTTPPCSESVIWTVFSQPLLVSPQKLNLFRSLTLPREAGGADARNFRPVQPLNGRQVALGV